jgi:hypothetical protein
MFGKCVGGMRRRGELTNNFDCGLTIIVVVVVIIIIIIIITLWSTVHLEQLRDPKLVKKSPAFYGTRKFITAFSRSANCPYPKPEQSYLCLPIPLLEYPF